MKPLRERIEGRIHETICRACIYEKADGSCGLQRMPCPIISKLDEIIQIVQYTRSNQIDPYVDKLRSVVCSECQMQDAQGNCRLRAHADCALDDYFVLLVDLVEQEVAREPVETG